MVQKVGCCYDVKIKVILKLFTLMKKIQKRRLEGSHRPEPEHRPGRWSSGFPEKTDRV